MSCITINDLELINTLLVAITLIIACLGVGAWRTQLKGTFAFTKKRELISELRKYKNQYQESLSKIRFYLEIFDEPIEKQVLITHIINPMKEQLIVNKDILESIKSLILEISPIDKKINKNWSMLDLKIDVFHIFYDSLLFEIENTNKTHNEIKEKLQELVNPGWKNKIDKEIDNYIKFFGI